jgi:hypothetical protein
VEQVDEPLLVVLKDSRPQYTFFLAAGVVHQLAPQGIEQRIVDMSLESEKAPPLPKRMYTEDENPSKPPTEVHQLAPQGIEQRIVDISLVFYALWSKLMNLCWWFRRILVLNTPSVRQRECLFTLQ